MLKRLQVSGLPFLSTIVAFMAFALLASSAANSQTAPSSSKSTFKTNCALCHGEDGAGTPLGKRLQAPDLRSKEVQGQPSAALAQIISKGKNNMPPFGGSLDAKQIHDLVRYIRQFRAGAPATAK